MAKLRSSENVKQDESGQWWHYDKRGTRLRCETVPCPNCGEQFPRWDKRQKFCNRRCAVMYYRSHPEEVKAHAAFGGRGEKSAHWRGGRHIDHRGYVRVYAPNHPAKQSNSNPYVGEHRLAMEEMLGRPLKPFERVHHKNGIKTDNRPENLELWQHGHPAGQRTKEREPMIQVPLSLLLTMLSRFTITVA